MPGDGAANAEGRIVLLQGNSVTFWHDWLELDHRSRRDSMGLSDSSI